MTKATFYFAQTFGDKYGEWLFDDLYGYVWRPFYNDYYPGGSWSPYFYGQWAGLGGQMFWVPAEPWGWVPYHLGVWQWDAKRGWFWLPGSAFAPAWVDWAYMQGSYWAWRPWSLFDWTYYGGMWGMSWSMYDSMWGLYWMDPTWYFNSFYSNLGQVYFGAGGDQNFRATLMKVSKDQLKKPSGSPALTMPKEFNRVLKVYTEALKRGEARVLDSLGPAAKPALLAGKRVINPVRVERPSNLAETRLSGAARRISPALGRMMAPVASLATRTVDWNPDVRLGTRLGVNIRYSSGTNEVVCPELRLSSAMMGRGVLVERGTVRSSDGSMRPGISGGSMSTGGSSSSGESSSGSSSSGGGGGGHIRS